MHVMIVTICVPFSMVRASSGETWGKLQTDLCCAVRRGAHPKCTRHPASSDLYIQQPVASDF